MPDPNSAPMDAVLAFDQIETLAPGITCEWLDDRQIVVYTIATVARTSIDALLERMKTVLIEWPVDRPYLVVYLLGGPSSDGPTPYIRERMREVQKARPEMEAHIAIITTRSFQGQLVRLYTQTRGNAARIFFNREEGIAWLRGFLRDRKHEGA